MAAAPSAPGKPLALIVGVGDGLSASVARRFHRAGYRLVLSARDTAKLSGLASETDALTVACDATSAESVEELFRELPSEDPLEVVVYNPSRIVRGPVAEVDPEEVRKSIDVTAFGSFLVGQQAARRMQRQRGGGAILLTGASAGVKGFPRSAAFAMGKFAQRGLAESMARELHPRNVHVCWVNIDGGIRNPGRQEPSPDSMLDPDAIAEQYLGIVKQHRSAWSNEVALRPWVEKW
jgi:NAD(P)-dependent dehydrogenase (short-subunit alcohol dehydrogenase family)